MKLSVDFGRWTTTKAVLAIAGTLAIAGAVGSAVAMSPVVQPPIKWAGGAEFNFSSLSGGTVYVVPAGRNFILTDLVVSNSTGSQATFSVLTGTSGGTCNVTTPRMVDIIVPAGDAAYLSLQTGIGFASGQAVCVANSAFMSVNGRGFLFTPQPPV